MNLLRHKIVESIIDQARMEFRLAKEDTCRPNMPTTRFNSLRLNLFTTTLINSTI